MEPQGIEVSVGSFDNVFTVKWLRKLQSTIVNVVLHIRISKWMGEPTLPAYEYDANFITIPFSRPVHVTKNKVSQITKRYFNVPFDTKSLYYFEVL